MSQNIDISIVIVNYNVKDFLAGCLKSIAEAETDLSVETIVVDNNSVDKSVEYLSPLFPDVAFIALDDNIGFGRANNIGIERSKGKYVLILNPDTIIGKDTIDVMYQFMENNPKCGIAGCKVLNPDGTFQVACRRGFPTPWASFSKLFGLQSLFPKSPLFAKYNQLYKSIDETYPVDAVIGAFMFARRDALIEVGGFDPEFFMYGEDLDLCRQITLKGLTVYYVHTTSIIHYKGESTKRSSINDVKHFYEAMEIFTRKHFGSNHIFLLILKFGIKLRSILAYLFKFKRDVLFIITDVISINAALLLGTKIRFGAFFGFPDHAYPLVLFVVTAVFILSMLAVGEYFEGRNSVRKGFIAAMMSFFALSSLTYFFSDFAFSRGVVLMSIGFTIIFVSLSRAVALIFDKLAGKDRDRRIIIVGTGATAQKLTQVLSKTENSNAIILGYVETSSESKQDDNLNILGEKSYLNRIITKHKPGEVIFTDDNISPSELINIMLENSEQKVRFHQVKEYDELLAAQIIDDISGIEPTLPKYNLSLFRYKVIKRLEDVVVSSFLLTLGLPFILMFKKNGKEYLRKLTKVFNGKMSFIGLHSTSGKNKTAIGKTGIIGPSATENPHHLTSDAIDKLNDYYIRHYNMSLDFDVFIKYLIRK